MIGKVSAKYAVRSLLRHPRRTILSVLGAGVGCALGMIALAYYGGAAPMQIRAVAEAGGGHLRVVPKEWPETRENSLRLVDWEKELSAVRAEPGVRFAAPRARANGLLAMGSRTAGVEVTGVEPGVESASNRVVSKSEMEGRYLQAGDAGSAVIGRHLARKLDVGLEDELFVMLSARGEMQSGMLSVVGILDSGSRDINLSLCHVMLEDLAGLTGYEGAGEISILLDDAKLTDSTQKALVDRTPPGNTVITWRDVNPLIAANIEGDTAFFKFLGFVVMVVVVLGITSAQLTAVLERRREFGVLKALGMKGRQLVGLIMLEAVIVGLGGAAVALLLGGYVAYLFATKGVDITAVTGESSFGGALFDPIIYGDFDVWLIWYALGVCVTATIVAAVYPSWFAVRTNPAEALRVG